LVAFDDGTKGCILTTDVIAGCLNYSVDTGFCSDGYCDTANGYTQVAQVGDTAGITCIPSNQVKGDCATYTYDAVNNLYLCDSCATGTNGLYPISFTPV
jgi:hypothetical protein